ncbi:hypothetical protein AAG906_035262 [Vitis piasezkii]
MCEQGQTSSSTVKEDTMMPGDQSRGKKKKKAVEETRALSWQEKKELADREEEDLEKEVEQLITWTNMIDVMDDDQLKEYLKNRPDDLKTVKTKAAPSKRLQRTGKPKSSTTNTIMASVWKFHKEDGEEASTPMPKT